MLTTDAHIFQITHTGALMCSRLPVPNGFDLVAFLDRWQTLMGAAVGGIMGVVGALIVASRATRRERRIAAGALLPELMSFRGAQEGLEKAARERNLPKTEVPKAICRSLLRVQPVVIVLHSPALGQLSDIDAALYAHLNHCQMIHRYFKPDLAEFAQMDNAAKAPMPAANIPASEELLQKKAADVVANWNLIVEHATLANYLLDRFIFRRRPAWMFKLRIRFFPIDLDKRSAYLIKEGRRLADANAAPFSSIDRNTPI
jgi:hypothetical protein